MSNHQDSGDLFLSTPSARRATGKQDLLKYSYGISIHALREEGDLAGLEVTSFERQFLSTPSARRATRSSIVYHFSWSFLSTPSARRATQEKHT